MQMSRLACLLAISSAITTAGCRTSAIEVQALTPDETVMRVGDTLTMTVVLTGVPTADITVRLFTSDDAVATIVDDAGTDCTADGCTIAVAAGAISGSFDVRGVSVGAVELTASVGPTSAGASAQVLEREFVYDSGTPGVDSAVPSTDSAPGVDSAVPGTDAAVPGTDSTVGPVCSSLSFDGTMDVVDVDLGVDALAGDLTIEAWVNFNVLTGMQVIVGSATVGGPTLRANGTALEFLVDGIAGAVSASGALTSGTWHHVAGVWNQTAMSADVWIDGVNAGNMAPVLATPFAGNVTIGAESSTPVVAELDGLLDGVRVSAIPRYTAPFTPVSPLTGDVDTFGLWLFDEGSGTTATDSATFGHDGVITGAAYMATCAP